MKHTADDTIVFKNQKGEEYKMKVQDFRNSAAGQQNKDHRPRFHDQAVRNLHSGLDHVEKANATQDRAFAIQYIENSKGKVVTDYR